MPLFTFMCFDKPDHVDLRLKTRAAHLAWVRESGVKILFAGPVLADDGQTPTGSLFLLEFDTLAAARAFQKTDPYDKAGLFERVVVQPTRKVFPET